MVKPIFFFLVSKHLIKIIYLSMRTNIAMLCFHREMENRGPTLMEHSSVPRPLC